MPYKDPAAKKAHDRAYYLKHREARMAYIKEWQSEHSERVKQYKRKWEDANPEYQRLYYLENREQRLGGQKQYVRLRYQEDPEHMRAMARNSTARYRARRREAYVENVDPLKVWERDGGICGICGDAADAADWHMDHVVPIVRGGEHSYANVQVAHPLCNWRKAAS